MSALQAALAAATTPSPATTAPMPQNVAPDPNSVTPGLLGFLVVFALAIALWLLVRNLTGKLRRMRYREDERLAREAAEGGPDAGQPGGAGGAGGPGGRRGAGRVVPRQAGGPPRRRGIDPGPERGPGPRGGRRS